MIRQADFTEISDGIRYTSNDMAKLGCEDCKGCSACCKNMEDTIVLDPYDVYNLTSGLSCSFEELLKDAVS